MTNFQPPPPTPQEPHGQSTPATPTAKPWSAAAIAGFVLSLLGCMGITAALGLILGVVGIVRTTGGRRRGLGFAVAAIPISLVTGVLSLLLLMLVLVTLQFTTVVERLPSVFAAEESGYSEAVVVLRELGSDEFKKKFSSETLTAWLKQVAQTHGKLLSVKEEPTRSRDNLTAIVVVGTFANGNARIQMEFSFSGFDMRLDDLAVDGLSPRPSGDP